MPPLDLGLSPALRDLGGVMPNCTAGSRLIGLIPAVNPEVHCEPSSVPLGYSLGTSGDKLTELGQTVNSQMTV